MAVLRLLSVVVALAAASPVAAQVAATGPYLPIDADATQMVNVAEGTVSRAGAIGRATVITLTSPAARTSMGVDIARLDTVYEFQCGGANFRTTAATAYDSTGALLADLPEATEWELLNTGTPNEAVRSFVCDGTRRIDASADSVAQLQDFYTRWLAGEFND
jgi:hypothetical protein